MESTLLTSPCSAFVPSGPASPRPELRTAPPGALVRPQGPSLMGGVAYVPTLAEAQASLITVELKRRTSGAPRMSAPVFDPRSGPPPCSPPV